MSGRRQFCLCCAVLCCVRDVQSVCERPVHSQCTRNNRLLRPPGTRITTRLSLGAVYMDSQTSPEVSKSASSRPWLDVGGTRPPADWFPAQSAGYTRQPTPPSWVGDVIRQPTTGGFGDKWDCPGLYV